MIIHDLFSNFLFSRSLGDGNHRGEMVGGVEEGTLLNTLATP
jgi:hypothetical protein